MSRNARIGGSIAHGAICLLALLGPSLLLRAALGGDSTYARLLQEGGGALWWVLLAAVAAAVFICLAGVLHATGVLRIPCSLVLAAGLLPAALGAAGAWSTWGQAMGAIAMVAPAEAPTLLSAARAESLVPLVWGLVYAGLMMAAVLSCAALARLAIPAEGQAGPARASLPAQLAAGLLALAAGAGLRFGLGTEPAGFDLAQAVLLALAVGCALWIGRRATAAPKTPAGPPALLFLALLAGIACLSAAAHELARVMLLRVFYQAGLPDADGLARLAARAESMQSLRSVLPIDALLCLIAIAPLALARPFLRELRPRPVWALLALAGPAGVGLAGGWLVAEADRAFEQGQAHLTRFARVAGLELPVSRACRFEPGAGPALILPRDGGPLFDASAGLQAPVPPPADWLRALDAPERPSMLHPAETGKRFFGPAARPPNRRPLLVAADGGLRFEILARQLEPALAAGRRVDLLVRMPDAPDLGKLRGLLPVDGLDLAVCPFSLARGTALLGASEEPEREKGILGALAGAGPRPGSQLALLPAGDRARMTLLPRPGGLIELPLDEASEGERRKLLDGVRESFRGMRELLIWPQPGQTVAEICGLVDRLGLLGPDAPCRGGCMLGLGLDRQAFEPALEKRIAEQSQLGMPATGPDLPKLARPATGLARPRPRARPEIRMGAVRVRGGLSREIVRRHLRRYSVQFRYCYERELSRKPDLKGKAEIAFRIASSGRTGDARSSGSLHERVRACIERVVRRMRFPPPKGAAVRVELTLDAS